MIVELLTVLTSKALCPPKLTRDALKNPVPVMVTLVPPPLGPELGETRITSRPVAAASERKPAEEGSDVPSQDSVGPEECSAIASINRLEAPIFAQIGITLIASGLEQCHVKRNSTGKRG